MKSGKTESVVFLGKDHCKYKETEKAERILNLFTLDAFVGNESLGEPKYIKKKTSSILVT